MYRPVVIAILSYAVLLTACSGNGIEFDESSMRIESAGAGSINQLLIVENDTSEIYLVKKEGVGEVESFKLTEVSKFYETFESLVLELPGPPFKFKPNSTYVISNITNGDAGPGVVMIRIDANFNAALVPFE